MRLLTTTALCVIATVPGALLAQDTGPISTDRPGITDSAFVLAPGIFQLETGFAYAPAERRIDVAPNLLRFGALRGLELRIGLPGFVGSPDSADGFSDGQIAVRFRLRGETSPRGAAPLLQATIGTTLPTGTSAYRVDAAQPYGQIVAAWLPGDSSVVSVQFQVAGLSDGSERWLQTLAGASLYVAVHERWTVFAEPVVISGLSAGGETRWILDGGLVWLATSDLQFDVSGGVNLDGGVATGFVGAGVATRF